MKKTRLQLQPENIPRLQFAELIQVTHTTVANLISQGMPDPKRGWISALRWYLRYIDRGRSVDSEARAAWERERARKLQIENEAREGLLVKLADVDTFLSEIVLLFASQLGGLGGRLAAELADTNCATTFTDNVELKTRT